MPDTATTDTHTAEFRASHGKRPLAFRCKKCGHLHEGCVAGEQSLPISCSVCHAGVTIGGTLKSLAAKMATPGLSDAERQSIAVEISKINAMEHTFQPDVWEVLADATPARLAELQLTPDQVERYTPAPAVPATRGPQAVALNAGDGVKVQSKVA